jgi:hypothetical protein
MLMKNLHKFYNNFDNPWMQLVRNKYNSGNLPGNSLEGSFLWKAHIKLIDNYKVIARCNLA